MKHSKKEKPKLCDLWCVVSKINSKIGYTRVKLNNLTHLSSFSELTPFFCFGSHKILRLKFGSPYLLWLLSSKRNILLDKKLLHCVSLPPDSDIVCHLQNAAQNRVRQVRIGV